MFEFMYKLSRKSVAMNKLPQFVYKCEIPRTAQIGSGVTFNHKGLGVVIHPDSQIDVHRASCMPRTTNRNKHCCTCC